MFQSVGYAVSRFFGERPFSGLVRDASHERLPLESGAKSERGSRRAQLKLATLGERTDEARRAAPADAIR